MRSFSKDLLDKEYKNNYVVERKIVNCDNLKQLNPSSCNTLRVHTFRNKSSQMIEFISAYVRIGRSGRIIDNASNGGIACRVIDGRLAKYGAVAVPHYEAVTKTDSGIVLENYRIDKFEEIVATAIKAHSNLPFIGLIGWDITVNENGEVVIIEYNPNPDMRKEQLIFKDTLLVDKQEEVFRSYW